MILLLLAAFAAHEGEVEKLFSAGKVLTALSVLIEQKRSRGEPVPEELEKRLAAAQEDFLAGRGGEFHRYRVKAGETLWEIGRRLHVTPEFLARINRIKDPRRLRAGRFIKVVEGPFSCRISLSQRKLRVYLGRALVREYDICVGTPETPTPTGWFRVREKVKNPRYDRGGEHYGPGDPRNPAGTRWIRLKGPIGIHGTNDPETIGKAASDGCIRLKNRDIEELFDLLVIGSTVEINP